jgi:glycogen(starch) synthase
MSSHYEDDAEYSTSLTFSEGPGLLSHKPLLFDISWEVARKVGGIYTVMVSKALITVQEWGDRYALIGPYNKASAAQEFEPIPPSQLVTEVLDDLKRKHGIIVYFGRWLVKGYPRVFLIDTNSSMHNLGKWRYELEAGFEVSQDFETNEAIVFGYQVATFLEELIKRTEDRPILAHFHEWLAGVGLIVSKRRQLPVATLFTTHATLLGRYMAAGRVDLYNRIQHINADQEAGTRQIYHRHWIEVGAARGSDVFTSVSEITGFEAEHALGRKPDVITPNGLNIERFEAVHEFQSLHKKYKDKIQDFVRGHFYGHNLDLDKTIYFFTAGRREYYNKGVDLFIEAMAELNFLLKRDNVDLNVVAFIIIPGNTNNYNVESIKAQSVRREIREICNKIVKKISDRMYDSIMEGEMPNTENLLTQEDIVNLKRRVQTVKQQGSVPPIVTHNVVNDEKDEILNHLRTCRLFNQKDDKVKVIYHPEFLNATSPIFPLDYEEFVRGCHMGVFPSYYEPWGYTPAECTVLGVPSISTNLTGFSNFICHKVNDPESYGIYVVDRRFKSFDETKKQMANVMYRFCHLTRRQRIELRNKTEKLSNLLDWKTLGKYYVKARNLALRKVFNMEMPVPEFFREEEEKAQENL